MDPTLRFSNRVEDYIRFRPEYPSEVVDFLLQNGIIQIDQSLADIGSGTGKSTRIFTTKGIRSFAVEPNQAMREAAETLLGNDPKFISIDGTAEATTLSDHSIDLIVAGQAFHWFDKKASRVEFKRILKPQGQVLLMWNIRDDDHSPFMKAYNDFLHEYSTDYSSINLRKINADHYRAFFGHGDYQYHSFPNIQIFDLEGLKGRYFSCSYALSAEHESYGQAIDSLKKLFDKHEKNGQIEMAYRTELYWSALK